MNAYLKYFTRIAGCLLLLLLVVQAVFMADAAWATKKLGIQFEGQSDGDTIHAAGSWDGHYYGPETIYSDREYTVGDDAEITITVIPGGSSEFSHWSGDQEGAENPLSFSMGNSHQTVVANFTTIASETLLLGLTISGEGSGSITLDGTTHDYTASESRSFEFDLDEEVTLTATPSGSDVFSGWGGVLSGTSNSEELTMTADKAVTATFGPQPVEQLTLTIDGTGTGTVTLIGSSGEHTYGSTSSGGVYDFYTDETVALTGTPGADVTLEWGGAASGTASEVTVSMDSADQAVTATFDEEGSGEVVEVSLSLTFSGEGGGSVSMSGSQGNSCSLDAEGSCTFNSGELVTLRANADIGSEFTSWSGGLSSTENSDSFIVTEDTSCEVAFAVAEDTTVPGCGSSTFTDYDSGFEATHFDLNNVSVSTDGYLQLQTGDDAIDPNNIIIPFEQEVSVTFLHEGAGYSLSDFGWMLEADGSGGTRHEVYENVNDNNGNGVLDNIEDSDTNGDGEVNALDNRVVLGTFAAGTELVFYLKVDDDWRHPVYFTKESWNPDVYDGDCTSSLGQTITKNFNLGLPRNAGTDTCSETGWLDSAALDRADDLFDLLFDAADTESMTIVDGEQYPHVIVGTPHDKPNEWILAWEDLWGGGDTDHNDMVFQVERRTGGVAELQTSQAIEPAEAGAYYTAVLFDVYDNIPCSGQTDINYYVSIDNGTNWVEITAWDTVQEYTLEEDGTITLGDDVSYWLAGSPQYTFRSRRIDFSSLGIIGDKLIWKTVLSSEEETCIAEIIDVKLTGTVATHADISRAAPVVQANVLYTGSFETPTVSWTSTDLRGHLRAMRTYDPLNTYGTDNVELWDAGEVLTAASPSARNIYCPSIALATVTGESLATADGTMEDFSGTLAHFPVLAESVTITVATETFTDKNTDVLEGNLGGTGTINRFTGEWEITPHETPGGGLPVTANYSWYIASSPLQAFTAGNVTNAMLDLDDTYVIGSGFSYDFNGDDAYTEADGDWLVNWVRGYSDGSSTKKEWVLDPIDHSVPAVVTPPGKPLWYYGTDISDAERTAYLTFVENNEDRDTIVLVGSRSGMLHAFNGGQVRWGDNEETTDVEQRGYFLWDDDSTVTSWWSSFLTAYPDSDPEVDAPFFTWQTQGSKAPDYGDGSEKWAFIPANLLPRLKNNNLKGEDRAFVDASPAVSDVYIDTGSGAAWKTVALCAEGNGGDTVFALDITNTASPTFMWEFADPDLFRSRSSPAVAVLGRIVDAGTTKWAAFFVSGETYDDTLYPSIYVIDIADGSVIQRIFLNCEPAGAGGVPSGQPAIVDTDGNGYIDRMYIGTDKGYMYKVNLSDSPDEAAYPISHCVVNTDFDYTQVNDMGTEDESDDVSTTYSVPLSQRGHSIYASPTVVVDNSLTSSGDLEYNVRIFYGTGDSPYADEDIDTGNTSYHFFAYTDHAEKGSTLTSDIELDWFEALPAGHRVFASAFAAAGNIYFGTATSDTEDPCEGPNEGRIYGFTYSGLSVINDGEAEHGIEVGDIVTSPMVEDEHLYIKTRDGLKSFGSPQYNNAAKVGGLPYTRMRYWREIF